MLTVQPMHDPEAGNVVDVGITSDQYNRWAYSQPVQAAQKAQAADVETKADRVREAVILGAVFLSLFALERILGRKIEVKSAAAGSAVTTAARAAAGG